MIKEISDKKQKLIDAKKSTPIENGEHIDVLKKHIYPESTMYDKGRENHVKHCLVIDNSDPDFLVVKEDGSRTEVKISREHVHSRELYYIGANPFETKYTGVRPVAFTLESILFTLDILGDKRDPNQKPYTQDGVIIKECNWNPYVYTKNGEKEYYQRPFVWSLQDKQSLVHSIYQDIECGRILVRKRSWAELAMMVKKGETEIAFKDIVDGKQRLNAIQGFLSGEFTDFSGNYYGDLSTEAQRKFTNHQLFSYAELPEDTPDENVVAQFLKLNFAGVPQSVEHIEYVNKIFKKM